MGGTSLSEAKGVLPEFSVRPFYAARGQKNAVRSSAFSLSGGGRRLMEKNGLGYR